MGEYFGADLFSAEVDYLIEHEWARSAEDILWRRRKLGLFLNEEEISKLKLYFEGRFSGLASKKPAKAATEVAA